MLDDIGDQEVEIYFQNKHTLGEMPWVKPSEYLLKKKQKQKLEEEEIKRSIEYKYQSVAIEKNTKSQRQDNERELRRKIVLELNINKVISKVDRQVAQLEKY